MIWSPSRLTSISGCWRRHLAVAFKTRSLTEYFFPVSASSILRNFIRAVTSTLMFWVTGGISLWEAHIRWDTTLRIPASLMTVSPSISSRDPALGAGAAAGAA